MIVPSEGGVWSSTSEPSAKWRPPSLPISLPGQSAIYSIGEVAENQDNVIDATLKPFGCVGRMTMTRRIVSVAPTPPREL
jgi:hypothetical protein